jgi:hypothetical protein
MIARHTTGDPGMSAATLTRGLGAYEAFRAYPGFAEYADRLHNRPYIIAPRKLEQHVLAYRNAKASAVIAERHARCAA